MDFPAPLGPMIPSASPGPSVKLTSRTAQNSPPPSVPSAGRLRKARGDHCWNKVAQAVVQLAGAKLLPDRFKLDPPDRSRPHTYSAKTNSER